MNILVTGGAGFIGSHMAKRHLADGHRVVVVDDLSTGTPRAAPGRRALRPGRHRADRPRAPAARGEDRLRLAPRGADRPAPLRRRPDRRRARQHPREPHALRGMRRARHAAASSSRRPAARSTASRKAAGRPPRATHRPQSRPTAARSSRSRSTCTTTASSTACSTQVFRYANVYGPGQNGTGEAGVVAIFSEAILGPAAAEDPRRRRADPRLRLRRRSRGSRRARGTKREERHLEPRDGSRDVGQPSSSR